jgi:hypothetical protein
MRPDRQGEVMLRKGIYYAWKETYKLSLIFRRVAGAVTLPFIDLAVNLELRYHRRTFLPVEPDIHREASCESF